MQCQTCGYSLWNLRTRQCPECSAPFKPSDFEFVRESVKFCCPHCGPPYFGTDEKGHLVPPVFDCAQCHARIHMDEMVLQPAEGVREQQTRVERMPWLERQERGLVRSWFAMLKWAMVQPNRLMRAIPEDSSPASAWLYATITIILFSLVGLTLPQVFFFGVTGRGWMLSATNMVALSLVGTVVGCGLFVLLWALIAHFMLLVTGGKVKPLARTCQAIFYSAGAALLA